MIFELSTLKNVRIHIWIIFVAQGRAITQKKSLTRDQKSHRVVKFQTEISRKLLDLDCLISFKRNFLIISTYVQNLRSNLGHG